MMLPISRKKRGRTRQKKRLQTHHCFLEVVSCFDEISLEKNCNDGHFQSRMAEGRGGVGWGGVGCCNGRRIGRRVKHYLLPNRQRTLNKPPTVLRRGNFLSIGTDGGMRVGAKACQSACVQRGHVPTGLPPLHAAVGGWVPWQICWPRDPLLLLLLLLLQFTTGIREERS